MPLRIRTATPDPALADALAGVLIDCVEGGASVGFMLPLAHEKAVAFWTAILLGVARDERILLIAEDESTNELLGTVQLVLNLPENQPHRADLAKMQVRRSARNRGVGAALLQAAEAAAVAAGRTLVLDTVTDSPAERLYARHGWQRCGVIPDYALWPHGGLVSTTVMWKRLELSPRCKASAARRHRGLVAITLKN